MKDVLETIGILALVALFIGAIVLFVLSYSAAECVHGGYAAYRIVGKVGICVGVGEDGAWKAEPHSDVQARLGQD
jgi:hypothetical protein